MAEFKRIPTDEITDRSFSSLTELLWAIEDNENTRDPQERTRRLKIFLRIGIGLDIDIQKTIEALVAIIGQSRNMAEAAGAADVVQFIEKQMAQFGE